MQIVRRYRGGFSLEEGAQIALMKYKNRRSFKLRRFER